MKRVIANLTALGSFLLFHANAFAQGIGSPCQGGNSSTLCDKGKNSTDVGKIVGAIVNLLFLVAGIIALIYLVIGGIKWITSEGDSKNVEAARNQIIAAAIGLALTFLSYLILNILLKFLGVGDFGSLSIPTIQ